MSSNKNTGGLVPAVKKPERKLKWTVSGATGGSLSPVAPLLSSDERFMIVLTSTELRAYTFLREELVASVTINSAHSVVDMVFAARDEAAEASDGPENVWLVTRAGKFLYVDWTEKAVTKTVKFDLRIWRIIAIDGPTFVVVAVLDTFKSSDLSIVRLEEGTVVSKAKVLAKIQNFLLCSLSQSRRCVTVAAAAPLPSSRSARQTAPVIETVHTLRLADDLLSAAAAKVKRTRKSSTIAVSDNGLLAVGAATGVIDLYYPLPDSAEFAYTDDENEYVMRTLKWHLDPVRALNFSLNGDYLLSGGNEKVLVFWQLDTNNVQFLPRLPGVIRNIVRNENSTLYALCLGNNNTDIIGLSATDLNSRVHIAGVKPTFHALPRSSYAQLPRTSSSASVFVNAPQDSKAKGTAAAAGKTPKLKTYNYTVSSVTVQRTATNQVLWYFATPEDSQVQVYDPAKGEQVAMISVAPTLQTGKIQAEEAIPDPRVTQLDLAVDGDWMVTVDEVVPPPMDDLMSRNDLRVNLKFWHNAPPADADTAVVPAGAAAYDWRLASRIVDPHGKGVPVAAVVAAPKRFHKGLAFATACPGGGVRIWRPTFPKLQSRQVVWTVRHILPPAAQAPPGDRPSVALAWSDDGSMLVLGVDTHLHVIAVPRKSNPEFRVVKTLPSVLGSPVRSLSISDTYLAVVSKTRTTVVDLLSSSALWSLTLGSTPAGGAGLAAYGPSFFACAVNADSPTGVAGTVYVFEYDSPLPIHVYKHSRPIACIKALPAAANVAPAALGATASAAAFVTAAASRKGFALSLVDTDALVYTLSTTGGAVLRARKENRASSAVAAASAAAAAAADGLSLGLKRLGITPEDASDDVVDHDHDHEDPLAAFKVLNGTAYTREAANGANGTNGVASLAAADAARVHAKPLTSTALDQLFSAPEYAAGSIEGMFDQLLDVIGQTK
ncbi:uncharacterized protein V1510DRAFT_401627 [Dipodascopsis tothii]|uniref:uncharacterized protein n=1 Tax=Dipodascopsis tothii TaxID=44089 RepID=UPI0034CDFA30